VYIGKPPTVGNFQVCDAISVVNGQAAYTLQVGGVNVAPESANHMLVSLNGILQKPGSSFTISGSTMTFASNLATGDVIDFVQILGNVLDIGQPSDDTVTAAKLNNDVISGQTALTSAPADTDELLISDAGTIKRIDVSLVGGKNTPAFLAKKSSNQTISDNTATKVTFAGEEYDTNSAYASDKFTVPSGEAGKYTIYGNLQLQANGGNDLETGEASIRINGSEAHVVANKFGSNEPVKQGISFMATIALSVSDYVEIYAKINSEANADCFVRQETSGLGSYFGAYKIIT